MKDIRKIRYAVGIAFIVAFSSFFHSCNYLNIDEYIYDKQTLDSVFYREDLMKQYLNSAATYLPDESKMYVNAWGPFAYSNDEAFASQELDIYGGMYLMLDHDSYFDNRFNNWTSWYKGIRKANIFLARNHECKNISDADRAEFTGRAYFLLGYYYYLLVQQYGPVPIIKDVLSSDDTVENLSKERDTYEDCINYINECMLKAYDYLPPKRENTQQYIPTRDVALAVLSRVWLHAASPLFNGGTGSNYYTGWQTSDGRDFIPQVEDNSKWGKSAVMSKQIISMGKYQLYTIASNSGSKPLPEGVICDDADFYEDYPKGANGIDHYLSCMSTFTGEAYALDNMELIYYCRAKTDGDSDVKMCTPCYLDGWGCFNVPQDMVDAYKQDDGTVYQKPSDGWEEIGQNIEFGNKLFTIVPKTPKMYANREARFYASIGYTYRQWKGTATTNAQKPTNVVVTYFKNSSTGGPSSTAPNDYNRSGYTCVKYIHPEDHQGQLNTVKSKVFPIFRYAEILLNYAEALNELKAPYTDEKLGITVSRDVDEIKNAVNLVRHRAGLPGLSNEECASVETLRKAIKQERRVELAFEGRRYHDLRRWGDANVAINTPMKGMDVSKKEIERQQYFTEIYLNTEKITQRIFTPKMNFYPIPKVAMDANGKLVQNPGWSY